VSCAHEHWNQPSSNGTGRSGEKDFHRNLLIGWLLERFSPYSVFPFVCVLSFWITQPSAKPQKKWSQNENRRLTISAA
jgi:hypothetical protein